MPSALRVYLDLLERFDSKEKEYDVDTLLLYEEGADVAALRRRRRC